MKKDKDAVKIIANLLMMVTVGMRKKWDDHLDQTQSELLHGFPEWITPALKYLEEAKKQGFNITLAHSDWVKTRLRFLRMNKKKGG